MRLSEAVATQPVIRIAVSSKGAAGSPGAQGPAGDVAKAASRSAMAAIPAAADGMVRFLGEGRRKGLFQFDESDLSAEVALDIDQGLYIAPANDDTGESGAWVRVFDGPVMADWFGLAGDNVTDDGPAVLRMFDVLDRNAAGYVASRGVDFGPRTYFLGTSTINIRACMKVRGAGIRATKLRWAAGASGIIVQRVNTADGLTGDAGAYTVGGGDLSHISDMTLAGGYAGVEGEFHGAVLRARAVLSDLIIDGFQGDGVYSFATAGGGLVEGNANSAQILRVNVNHCRRGLFIDGADTNVWNVSGCDFSANRTWGVQDSSYLGNYYGPNHASANGWDGALGAGYYTGTSYGGYRYGVIPGQEAWCSTNAPTGTTANNQGWYYQSPGGTYNGVSAWASGQTFKAGGAYYCDGGGGNGPTIFTGCYQEGDQGTSLIDYPAVVAGGNVSAVRSSGLPYGAYLGTGSGTDGFTFDRDIRVRRNLKVDNESTLGTLAIVDGDGASRWYETRINGIAKGYHGATSGGSAFIQGVSDVRIYAPGHMATFGSGALNLLAGNIFTIDGVKVMGARITGWTAPTGTASRAGFATGAATLQNVAETLKALIDDLKTQGVIGT